MDRGPWIVRAGKGRNQEGSRPHLPQDGGPPPGGQGEKPPHGTRALARGGFKTDGERPRGGSVHQRARTGSGVPPQLKGTARCPGVRAPGMLSAVPGGGDREEKGAKGGGRKAPPHTKPSPRPSPLPPVPYPAGGFYGIHTRAGQREPWSKPPSRRSPPDGTGGERGCASKQRTLPLSEAAFEERLRFCTSPTGCVG